jgi:hypothetical protein
MHISFDQSQTLQTLSKCIENNTNIYNINSILLEPLKYIFILYVFDVIKFIIFIYIVNQTL